MVKASPCPFSPAGEFSPQPSPAPGCGVSVGKEGNIVNEVGDVPGGERDTVKRGRLQAVRSAFAPSPSACPQGPKLLPELYLKTAASHRSRHHAQH